MIFTYIASWIIGGVIVYLLHWFFMSGEERRIKGAMIDTIWISLFWPILLVWAIIASIACIIATLFVVWCIMPIYLGAIAMYELFKMCITKCVCKFIVKG